MPDRPPARRTQRERREETERKVLAAATALIAERGSRALTLAEVGEAAGYSRGIVSHHFGSRENLLRAVMRDAQAFTLPDVGDSAADWLAETVRAYLKNVTSRRPAARAFLQMWGEAIAADPVLMPLYAEHDASSLDCSPTRSAKGSATARCEQMPIPRRWPCPSLASSAGSHYS